MKDKVDIRTLECPCCGAPIRYWANECEYCGRHYVVIGRDRDHVFAPYQIQQPITNGFVTGTSTAYINIAPSTTYSTFGETVVNQW